MSKRLWLAYGLLLALLLTGCGAATVTSHHAATGPTPSPTPTPKPTMLYLAAGQTVYALDVATGAKRWTYSTGLPEFASGGYQWIHAISAMDGHVYFTDQLYGDATLLYALSATDGSLLWKVAVGSKLANLDELFVSSGVVIANTGHSGLPPGASTAVDPDSGKILWTQSLGGSGIAEGAGLIFLSGVLHGSDALPDTNGALAAINPSTGAVVWQVNGHAYHDPIFVGNMIYANADDAVHAFDAQTGNPIWSQSFSSPTASSVVMTQQGSTLYLANGATLSALDGRTHTILWQTSFKGYYPGTVSNGVMCVASGVNPSIVYGIDASSGALRWQKNASGGIWNADNGLCIIADTTSTLSAVDAQSGAVKWTTNFSNTLILGAMIPHAGQLYALMPVYSNGSAADAILHVLSEADGSTQWTFDTHDRNQVLLAFE